MDKVKEWKIKYYLKTAACNVFFVSFARQLPLAISRGMQRLRTGDSTVESTPIITQSKKVA